MTIGLLVICTGKYDVFLPQLLQSVDQYFFPGNNIHIYLFSDKEYSHPNLTVFHIDHKPFPYPTLFRYKYFTERASEITTDYLFYIDVDMLIVNTVGKDILGDLIAVRHPGYYKGGWGDRRTQKSSLAFIPPARRKGYYCGGFQGGKRNNYLVAAAIMSRNIDIDEANGARAEWNDESHWNRYLLDHPFKELSPSYCYPEARWAQGLPFKKIIIALDKDHENIRK